MAPHGKLSLALLLWGVSRHHLGHFVVLKANLGTTATRQGVWLKEGQVRV